MTHLITRACCNDASCVEVCPVNCIHPTPAEPEFLTAEMLYIDPDTCIDCGACLDECPVSSIVRDDEMRPEDEPYLAINADYYRDHDVAAGIYSPKHNLLADSGAGLHVAVVGSGPAAFYVAEHVLAHTGAKVDMFERLPTPYGLIRAGVAPDHQDTKAVQRGFERIAERAEFRYFLNVEVGKDITHEELAEHYNAVVYATGASEDRKLDIPGEDLRNTLSAAEVVAWYNGHPDQQSLPIDLSVSHAVVIGNGNVALDVARILAADQDRLDRSDIPAHVVAQLRGSGIRQITVLARRSVADAAYTNSEFLALCQQANLKVVVPQDDLRLAPETHEAYESGALHSTTAAKIRLAAERAESDPGPLPSGTKRVVQFRYLTAPVEIFGFGSNCAGVRVRHGQYGPNGELRHDGAEEIIMAGLVIRAVGYRSTPVPGLPFSDVSATVPNERGRVDGMEGTYVAGWVKRGPRGGIGRNKACSYETADAVLSDFAAGLLAIPPGSPSDIPDLLRGRGVRRVDDQGWRRIDDAEVLAGRARRAPREKFVDISSMLAAASGFKRQ
ncbi:MAG: FAD-dependent oxidoreductase [Segniliparus sp.]|uniref:FAD-dependent oxidoreductase n=1 Tax=Segniliparus sp. TaxID=2804064 RepID=UPI003F306EC3